MWRSSGGAYPAHGYRGAACCKLPGGVQDPIHAFRHSVIIEAHGTTLISIVQNAQIGNFVAHLSDGIAEASRNDRHCPKRRETEFGVVRSTRVFLNHMDRMLRSSALGGCTDPQAD